MAAVWLRAVSFTVLMTICLPAGAQPVSPRARELFQSGVALLQDPGGSRYEDAYALFREAYKDSPSPKILGNLGLCALKLERDGEAIDALSTYLAVVDDVHPDERAQYETDLATLRSGVATIVLHIAGRATGVVDTRIANHSRPINNRYPVSRPLTLRVRAGHHRIRVEASPPLIAQELELDLQPGDRVEKSVVLAPLAAVAVEESPSAPLSTAFWVSMSVTGALGAATAIVGGLAAANHADYESALAAQDAPRVDELQNAGGNLNNAGDALLGLSIAGAVVTLVLLFVGPSEVAPTSAGRGLLVRF